MFGRVGPAVRDHLVWCSLVDDLSAVVSGPGADVDDPVGRGDDVEVVLNHDERRSGIDKPVEQPDEPGDVGDVQSRSRLVQDDRATGGSEFGGELESLTFAAREAGEGLSEGEVVESDVVEPGQFEPDGGLCEVVDCVGDAHLEHVGDVLAGNLMFLGLWGEPSSFADFAAGDHAFHEGEVGVDDAVALTGRASSGGVGSEQPGWCSGGLGEHVTDEVEQAGVGGWVGAA